MLRDIDTHRALAVSFGHPWLFRAKLLASLISCDVYWYSTYRLFRQILFELETHIQQAVD